MSGRTIAPILPALNLARAAEFYEKILDFKSLVLTDHNYALLDRDPFCIHLFLTTDKYLCENSGCYLYVDDVDAFYEGIIDAQGSAYTRGAPEDKPWGMREFYVNDTEGNLLRIGSYIN